MAINKTDANDKLHVTGTAALKDSQVYPRQYGQTVYKHWRSHVGEDEEDADWPRHDNVNWETWRSAHALVDWTDANLNDAAEFLSLPTHAPLV